MTTRTKPRRDRRVEYEMLPCCGWVVQALRTKSRGSSTEGTTWTSPKQPGGFAVCLNCKAVLTFDRALRLGVLDDDRVLHDDPAMRARIDKMIAMATFMYPAGRAAAAGR
jgi:hypothetical protein